MSICTCPLCGGNAIAADELLFIAELLLFPTNEIVVAERTPEPYQEAEAALAVAFYRRPAGFKLRALVEEWDRPRIVREMY